MRALAFSVPSSPPPPPSLPRKTPNPNSTIPITIRTILLKSTTAVLSFSLVASPPFFFFLPSAPASASASTEQCVEVRREEEGKTEPNLTNESLVEEAWEVVNQSFLPNAGTRPWSPEIWLKKKKISAKAGFILDQQLMILFAKCWPASVTPIPDSFLLTKFTGSGCLGTIIIPLELPLLSLLGKVPYTSAGRCSKIWGNRTAAYRFVTSVDVLTELNNREYLERFEANLKKLSKAVEELEVESYKVQISQWKAMK